MGSKVSVIIPTVRGGGLLQRAIDSVFCAANVAGLYGSIEVIVGDDGGGISSEFISRCAERSPGIALKCVRSKSGPKAGPSAARNSAIGASSGAYVFPLDDDDIFLPNRFENALKVLESDGAELVMETTLRCTDDRSRDFLTGPPHGGMDPLDMLLSGNWDWSVSQGATSFTRRAYESVGGYNEQLRFAEDGEFLCKLVLTCETVMLSGPPVTRYHYHSGNVSGPGNVFPWQNLKMLSALHRFARRSRCADQGRYKVASALRRKFDYTMSLIGSGKYSGQLAFTGLLESLRSYPLDAWTIGNLRSIGVAALHLTRSR